MALAGSAGAYFNYIYTTTVNPLVRVLGTAHSYKPLELEKRLVRNVCVGLGGKMTQVFFMRFVPDSLLSLLSRPYSSSLDVQL